MYGTNPIRPPSNGDGQTLNIQSIFATLQGEGIYSGWPAVFIRLGGCNLACKFCDTEFESFSEIKLEDIIAEVERLSANAGKRIRNLVVITGGEPFLQPISKLCEWLIEAEFLVQIETNGTLYRELPDEVDIICSPKNNGKGYFPVRQDLLARINAFKFIISAGCTDYSAIAEVGQESGIPVYVQPMDEYDDIKNKANLKLATKIAIEQGYRLSLQLHKIVEIE